MTALRLLRDGRAPVLVTGLLILSALAWSSLEDRTRPAPRPVQAKSLEQSNQSLEPTKTAPKMQLARIQLPPPPPLPTSVTPPSPIRMSVKPVAAAPSPAPKRAIKTIKAAEPITRAEPHSTRIKSLRPTAKSKPALAKAKTETKPPPLKNVKTVKASQISPTALKPAKIAPDGTPPGRELPVTAEAERQGRPLLRLLEHGKGPDIQIAWPADAATRAGLHRRLRACHGMRSALMHGDRFYVEDGAAGRAWMPNTDRYSGFMRNADGRIPPAEMDLLDRIGERHGLTDAWPVRLFERRFDAMLLGGLNQSIGGGYAKALSIRARYALSPAAILVRDIRVNGRTVAGTIRIPKPALCRGGRA